VAPPVVSEFWIPGAEIVGCPTPNCSEFHHPIGKRPRRSGANTAAYVRPHDA
jgi:hypothetical protein